MRLENTKMPQKVLHNYLKKNKIPRNYETNNLAKPQLDDDNTNNG